MEDLAAIYSSTGAKIMPGVPKRKPCSEWQAKIFMANKRAEGAANTKAVRKPPQNNEHKACCAHRRPQYLLA